ncbi:hypothetical protein [Streptomyces sp. NPDC101132]|uniref:hypothetical protein n=1 Tax=Streptomyces sp. NPDC101132 TaxID=3366110 RepID=UPI00381C4845
MTHSPTAAELAALKVAHAAESTRDASYDLVSTVVFALGSAQLLQSPETAAELARLRLLENATPAQLTEAQVEALADAGNRALNDHYHEDLCACVDWPQGCGHYLAGSWDTAAFSIGMAAVIGLWESMRAPVEAAELARLRARVDEVERRYTFDTAKLRARVAELEAERSEDRPIDEDPIAYVLTPAAEAPHEGPEHHDYRIPRDLPEYPSV